MVFTVSKVNKFIMIKLPSAFLSGVRLKEISDGKAVASVKFQWINQNPFKSMYWATQGMASELATGILLMKGVDNSQQKLSTLVTAQTGEFYKKAIGRINFICDDGDKINSIISKAIETKEGQKVLLTATGYNEDQEVVSYFTYTWSIKLKT
ncbi:DUF4442 domain-containing protein [Namhaeicola litoreus]|uniref:DUF4442 domain-containing protein n=1 Tax=Namhaeicola litoreus TaxID=1052145 RepID=A0ABW3Y5N7_9FLAO